MSDRWFVAIEAWPHSSGRGQERDQAAVGPREQHFVVEAEDASDALDGAMLIAMGMRSNPMVWMAPITHIRKIKEGES